jgi:hypothetical protein
LGKVESGGAGKEREREGNFYTKVDGYLYGYVATYTVRTMYSSYAEFLTNMYVHYSKAVGNFKGEEYTSLPISLFGL